MPRVMVGAVLVVAVTFAVVLAGCGGSSSDGAPEPTDAAAGPTTTTVVDDSAGGCPEFTPGQGGVVQTFCDGPGTVELTVGSETSEVKGLTCTVAGGFYAVNGGVIVGQDYRKAKPDSVGFLFPEEGGAFRDATISFTVRGTGHALTKNSGTVDVEARTGTFEGTDLAGKKVSGSFSC